MENGKAHMDRILLLIKDKKNRSLLHEWLSRHYPSIISDSGQGMDEAFDLGILDGPALKELRDKVRLRKETAKPVFLPFLLVTPQQNVAFATDQLWKTVDEIIVTPIRPVELQARVEILLQVRRLSLETQRLATTDELTGVNNRRHLFTLGEREFTKARRYARPLSAIMFDIDHFKRVNDTYGHSTGDQVLREVARRCLGIIRTMDVIGRYGGEEFSVVLPETNLPGALVLAERLRLGIAEAPVATEKGDVSVTISLGVCSDDGAAEDVATLFSRADTALYKAKQQGRNCVIAEGISLSVSMKERDSLPMQEEECERVR